MRIRRNLLKKTLFAALVVLILSGCAIGLMLRPRNDSPRLSDHAEKVVSLSLTQFPQFKRLYPRHLWLSNDTLLLFAGEGDRAQPIRLNLRNSLTERLTCEGFPAAAMADSQPLRLSPSGKFLLGFGKPDLRGQAMAYVIRLNPPGRLIRSPHWHLYSWGGIFWLPGTQEWINFNRDNFSATILNPDKPVESRRLPVDKSMAFFLPIGIRNDGTFISGGNAQLFHSRIGSNRPPKRVTVSGNLN